MASSFNTHVRRLIRSRNTIFRSSSPRDVTGRKQDLSSPICEAYPVTVPTTARGPQTSTRAASFGDPEVDKSVNRQTTSVSRVSDSPYPSQARRAVSPRQSSLGDIRFPWLRNGVLQFQHWSRKSWLPNSPTVAVLLASITIITLTKFQLWPYALGIAGAAGIVLVAASSFSRLLKLVAVNRIDSSGWRLNQGSRILPRRCVVQRSLSDDGKTHFFVHIEFTNASCYSAQQVRCEGILKLCSRQAEIWITRVDLTQTLSGFQSRVLRFTKQVALPRDPLAQITWYEVCAALSYRFVTEEHEYTYQFRGLSQAHNETVTLEPADDVSYGRPAGQEFSSRTHPQCDPV